jgi:quinol monooxygenase YgiN
MIVELRQYTLHPGTRDVLIELFDREFVESQEAVGMQVFGQFRDLDDPDRFVWLRGFRDMPTRARALEAFYGGPVWKQHRDETIATMIDSDNVLLLRPARPWSGLSVEKIERLPPGSPEVSGGLVVATIWHLDATAGSEFLEFFEGTADPALKDAGASILGYFVTETSPNNFPALPVREDENVFVCISGFSDQAAYDLHVAALARPDVTKALPRGLRERPDVLKLAPTSRSRLRG